MLESAAHPAVNAKFLTAFSKTYTDGSQHIRIVLFCRKYNDMIRRNFCDLRNLRHVRFLHGIKVAHNQVRNYIIFSAGIVTAIHCDHKILRLCFDFLNIAVSCSN